MMLTLDAQALTTAKVSSAYPWQCQPATTGLEPVIGLDVLGDGALFGFDPFAAYAAGLVTNPNMVVLGQVGKGKSALIKSFLNRETLRGRRCVIVDPKGEYGPLAELVGLDVVCLHPGGAARLNPLDAGPGFDGTPAELGRRRARLIGALAETGLGRTLTALERAAIAAAVAEIGTDAVLADVVELVGEPTPAMAARLRVPAAELAAGIRPAMLELGRLVDGDLADMFDGPTNVDLDWDGPGLVIDVAAVFDTPALAPVMACAGAWLAHAVADANGPPTLLVLDEAWALLRLGGVCRWLAATAKLARAYGVAVVLVAHRVSDFTAHADDGAETAKQAAGLLADVETRVIYAQAPGETAAAASLLGLDDGQTELISCLPAHRALWLIGRRPAVVDHVLSGAERAVCDTDTRMTREIPPGGHR